MLDWFNLHVEIVEAFLRSECDSDRCREELMLSCRGSELNALLIGKSHIFNSEKSLDNKRRRDCRFRIWMRKHSSLSAEGLERIGQEGNSVGELQFRNDQDSLDANIFVEDALFERWAVVLLSMRHQISGTVTITLDPNFSERHTVGDSSTVTWNIDERATVSTAKIRGWELEMNNRLWKESASESPYK